MNKTNIGKYISEKRKLANLTQKELADKLNVTDKAVSKWETGKGLPDTLLLIPLSEALNISVVELLDAKDIPNYSKKDIDEIVVSELEKEKKRRRKLIVKSVAVTMVVLLAINALIFAYWGRRHSVLYNVNAVYVTQSTTDENIYNISYNVTVKNWWFDFVPHTYMLKNDLGGSPGGWHFFAETEYFTSINTEESRIELNVEFDITTYDDDSSNPVEDAIRCSQFAAYDKNGEKNRSAALYMADFQDAEIIYL